MSLPTQREVIVHQLNAQDQDLRSGSPNSGPRSKKPLLRVRFILIIFAIAALVTVAMAGWSDLYAGFL